MLKTNRYNENMEAMVPRSLDKQTINNVNEHFIQYK